VEQLELVGEETNLALDATVQWPGSGRVTLRGEHIEGARLLAFLPPGVGIVRFRERSA
jgi:hypothetical protein